MYTLKPHLSGSRLYESPEYPDGFIAKKTIIKKNYNFLNWPTILWCI